jgi:pentatricopeptide repeat protein
MLTTGLKPNAATFHTIMSTLIERNEIDKALEILKIMGSPRFSLQSPTTKSYRILIHGLAERKRPDEALALLEEMYRLNLRPEVQSYTAIVRSYERIGRPLKAIEVMESMRENGYEFYDVEVSTIFYLALFLYFFPHYLCTLRFPNIDTEFSIQAFDKVGKSTWKRVHEVIDSMLSLLI